MRTTIIPAQITTVEDKIAGTLNLNQILILMIPVFWSAIVYAFLVPIMKLSTFKLGLILIVAFICLILAFRIKEKIIAEWLNILAKYQLRPRFYLFNKNSISYRTVDIPDIPTVPVLSKDQLNKPIKLKVAETTMVDLVKMEYLINTGKVALRYQLEKKQS